jgi:hypothetical protein
MKTTTVTMVTAIAVLGGCVGRGDFDETPVLRGCLDGPEPAWGIEPGYRAAIVADRGLDQPSGMTFAGGMFGVHLYVANHGNTTIAAVDILTGDTSILVPRTGWPAQPIAPTALSWDGDGVVDGGLYLADRGMAGDGDATIYAIDATGFARTFATGGPAPGDVYSLAFVDDAAYGRGLLVGGNSFLATSGIARYDAGGRGVAFSDIDGVSGLTVDTSGVFGGGVFASRPSNLELDSNNTVSRLSSTGAISATLITGYTDIHAAVFAEAGALGGRLYAATSSTIVAIDPAGDVAEIATAANFDRLDGNIIAIPPDGSALYVASRDADQIVCIEPDAGAPGQPAPSPPGGGGAGE